MRTASFLFLACPVFFAFECGKKCDTYEFKPLAGKTEIYFGPYKPGNWWVYRNKAGNMRDSIYTGMYTDVFNTDKSTCAKSQQRKFTLVSSYLVDAKVLYVDYEAAGSIIGVNFSLDSGSTQSAGFPQFIYFLDQDRIKSYPEPGYTGNNSLDSIRLNGITYPDILFAEEGNKTYYFSKDRGLVGWGTALDTFNLITFKIL